jgi:WD40 repeat protein
VRDATTGKLLATFSTHGGRWVSGVAFSPDGKRIVTGSWDKTAKIWSAPKGR